VTGYETPYTPHGRFVHVPPLNPSSNWMADVETPWWLDHGKYYLGKLSVRTRKLKIINTLTKDDHVMEVKTNSMHRFKGTTANTLLTVHDRLALKSPYRIFRNAT
jgi:hypothetical protein